MIFIVNICKNRNLILIFFLGNKKYLNILQIKKTFFLQNNITKNKFNLNFKIKIKLKINLLNIKI